MVSKARAGTLLHVVVPVRASLEKHTPREDADDRNFEG